MQLGRPFYDTDTLVEKRARKSIHAIVSSMGWPHFRDLEKQVIASLSGKPDCVIATGGGAIMDPANVGYLKRKGWIFWLRADAQTLRQRVKTDQCAGKDRPSLTGKDPLKEIQAVLLQREPVYQKICDVVIDTEGSTIWNVVMRILQVLGGGQEGRNHGGKHFR